MSELSTYVAAPFVGEFGWEVAMWAPWLRWMRNEHRTVTFDVLCKPGHQALYADFATRVIPVKEMPDILQVDCANAFVRVNGRLRREDYVEWVKRELEGHKTGTVKKGRVYTPLDIYYDWNGGRPPILRQRIDVPYGSDAKIVKKPFIAVHARAHQKQPDRNWLPREKWDELMDELDGEQVIAIGALGHSLCPRGAMDLRGRPLGGVMDLLSQCRVIVGPSSGPLHLANACRVPVVWWSGNQKDEERYATAWNPYHLPNRRVGVTWQPSVDEVMACLRPTS